VITAVDTNVLLDVLSANPEFGMASRAALSECLAEGNLVACDIVWAETASGFDSERSAIDAFQRLGIELSVLVQPAADAAGTAWRAYRRAGGSRARLAGDFLIGGHALVQAERLLTRDRGFFRSYFKSLKILDPTQGWTQPTTAS
jgi:predicted nucleic acid-binding protein